MDQQPVLVVTGDPAVQQRLTRFLQTRGLPAVVADTAERAAEAVSVAGCQFTLFDHGAAVLERLKAQARDLGPIIGVAPLGHDEDLDAAIGRRLGTSWRPPLAADGIAPQLRREMSLWRSPKMREVREILREAAGVDVTVLITGETGTGKDVVAQAIHALSARRTGPFVKVNCAAVPRELLETELFGHERGAFTGAHRQNIGKFESAHLGTMFLDEIGDLHPALQAKLLHVLQDGGFSRVGGKAMLKVDVRVVAATNQILEKAVADGRFREDLYYRLNVVQVQVPPLRERLEEVPALVDYFVERYSKMFRREGFALLPAAMDRLLQYRYPGNVRELENLVKRMIVLGDPQMARTPFGSASAILAAHGNGNGNGHAASHASADGAPRPARLHLKEISHNASLAAERGVIAQVLEETGWNRVHAARALKISYRALLYKMKRTGLHGPRPAPRAKETRDDS